MFQDYYTSRMANKFMSHGQQSRACKNDIIGQNYSKISTKFWQKGEYGKLLKTEPDTKNT